MPIAKTLTEAGREWVTVKLPVRTKTGDATIPPASFGESGAAGPPFS